VLPWGAARDVDQATEQWTDDPEAAFDRLERARDLNFLSDQPDLVAGAIAVRLDDLPRARAHFAAAVDRNPHSWYGLLELGAIEAVEGRTPAALAHLRRADELNPGDPVIDEALRAARRERPLALRAIDRRMLERLCARFGRTTETPDC
jgi:tetratricopeptide (TPR) repeat protein